MKKKFSFLSLIILIVVSLVAAMPTYAQEEADDTSAETILAQAAAESVLTTLVRPELASMTDFYLSDTLKADNPLADLNGVTGYTVTQADWLSEANYQLTATLQPGRQNVTLTVGRYSSRWLVDEIELAAAPPTTSVSPTTPTVVSSGSQPVAGNGSGKIVFQTQSGGGIYVINADGTGLQYVTNGLDPQLSPDGTQITFTRWEPRYELFVINIDGTGERALTHGWRQMKSPTWSADGSKITFSHQDGGRLEAERKSINLKDAARDREEVRVPTEAVGVELDGDTLRYTIPADAYWRLKQIDVNTLEMRDLYTERHSYGPTGHPNDANLLIHKGQKGIAVNNATTNTNQAVTTDHRDHTPIISPDGSKIAVSYRQGGHWEIHTMNINGSNRQRLTETPPSVLVENTLLKQEYVEGAERFVAPENPHWNNAAPVWSSDGNQLAFMTDRTGQWEVWIMNADGSDQRPMFSNGAVDDLTFNYAGVDERMLSWGEN